jgi:SNF2 family DNA or RNA helicase
VVTGSAGQRRKVIASDADVFLVNWEALRFHSRLAGYGSTALTDAEKQRKELNDRGFVTVIADESHHAKDPHAKQTRAMWALMREASCRWLMSGTPVVSHVGDLWSLLHAANRRAFPSRARYLDRWAKVELGFYGGAQILGLNPDTEAEFRAVTNPMIRRVPKELALPMLPPKLDVSYRHVEMSPAQAKIYRRVEEEMLMLLHDAEGAVSVPNAIAQLTRLLQFAAASARVEQVPAVDPGTGEEYHKTRVILEPPSSKVDDLVELLAEMDDEPLVVAAVSTQLLNLAAERLAREGVTYGLITGQQRLEDRQASTEMFQRGDLRVMLVNPAAGGEGITLTRARTLLFMQRDWSKVRNDQLEDRVHRMGQAYPVQVIDQVTQGTVESRKLQVIREKGDRIEEVIQDKASLLRLLGLGTEE